MRSHRTPLIHVDAHSGYKANERPARFELDGELYDITAVAATEPA